MRSMDQSTKERMEELIARLNEASYAYYQTDREIMTNLEYDSLYDELVQLEKESGIVFASSPTQKVGYPVVSSLPKVRHASPMKSLDKTKDIEALAAWLGREEGLLSWKLDGLTIVLTYEGGELVQAATRGNGEEGEVITPNARFFGSVPLRIPYLSHLVVRGEALISYEDFERVNEKLPPEEQYKNPRNLCSGSVRQLDSKIAASRGVQVVIYTLVESGHPEGYFEDSKEKQLRFLSDLGFQTVAYRRVDASHIREAEQAFAAQIEHNPFPVDGLVLTFDSISYSAMLGETAKFPRDSIAFKWQDEQAKTTLTEIEWSPSRTGLINPVAIFEPVELEGTTVQRASLHNLSILNELKLGLGDEILVYKANMIIPQIAENLTKSGPALPPPHCPRCGAQTAVLKNEEVEVLICTNPACPAKSLKALSHFVSRQALNIEGISDSIIERLAEEGLLQNLGDLFRLKVHRQRISSLEGFGERSSEKLLSAIEEARHTTLDRFLNGIGIPGIGASNARLLSQAFQGSLESIEKASEDQLSSIEGIGPVLAGSIRAFFDSPENQAMIRDLLQYLEWTDQPINLDAMTLLGKTFVITGALQHFPNRDALVSALVEKGAKVSGSVSSHTSYLINNDIESTSGKNKKAKELGIPIITEKEVLFMLAN